MIFYRLNENCDLKSVPKNGECALTCVAFDCLFVCAMVFSAICNVQCNCCRAVVVYLIVAFVYLLRELPFFALSCIDHVGAILSNHHGPVAWAELS